MALGDDACVGFHSSSRGGQVIILFAGAIVILALIGAMTIDVGRMVVSHAELQNAVDAAALAGASQLVGFVDETAITDARAETEGLAFVNRVAGTPLTLGSGDVVFGCVNSETGDFTAQSAFSAGDVVDSVLVTGRRTVDSPDGCIDLFFAPIFGLSASFHASRAIATQPRRYVMLVMDRSGSMCYDTTDIDHRYAPNADASMSKSPTGWYWMPRRIYHDEAWQTAWFEARSDATGEVVTSFLPEQVQARLMSGTSFRYCSRDRPATVQSGWLEAPDGVTIYSHYGPSYPDWSADGYATVSACDYALANGPIEPMASSQNAATAFVDLMNTGREQAGLVTYAWDAALEQQLTDDWAALKQSANAYDPRGATATAQGMKVANDEIILSGRANAYTVDGAYHGNPSSQVTVSFMGDNVACYMYQAVADAIAEQTRRARNEGIRIYTVSFGSGADQDLMPLIARATNGAYYYASDHASLTDIFRDIFYNLPAVLMQ